MTATERVLAHFDRISEAPDAVVRLRRFVLDLAVRGKLVDQDPNDEPASALMARIRNAGNKRPTSKMPVGKWPFELPVSWTWTRIGDCFNYDAGVKREPKELTPERWLLELEDIEKDTSVVIHRLRVCDRESRSTKSEFKAGDVLYGKLRPYLNKVVVASEDGYSTTEIVAIRPLFAMSARYCALALRCTDFVDYVSKLGRGTKMPRLRTPDAVVAPFPLPPLAEQHRIVTKVDELMALCDRLEAAQKEREGRRDQLVNASLARLNQPSDLPSFGEHARFHLQHLPRTTTSREHNQQLRQTIRNLAVRGSLTRREVTDDSATGLFERIRLEKTQLTASRDIKKDKSVWEGLPKEPPYKLPEGWVWTRLQDVFEISRGGSPRPAGDPRYFGGSIPWITVREVTKDSQKDLTSTESGLTEQGAERSRFIEVGDLLLTNSGATLGVPKVSSIRGCINDGVAVLRQFHSVPLNDFAYLYLHSQTESFRAVKQGMGQPNLNTGIIAGWFFPLPSLAEQRRIVTKVDELMAVCDRLDAQLKAGRIAQGALLEATLRDALTGPEPAPMMAAE